MSKSGVPITIQFWNETLDFVNELSEFLGVPRDEIVNSILIMGRKHYQEELNSVRLSIYQMLNLDSASDPEE